MEFRYVVFLKYLVLYMYVYIYTCMDIFILESEIDSVRLLER